MKRKYPIALFLVVLLVVVFSGCAGPGPEVNESFSGEYETVEGTVLKVTNVNGEVVINSWDGDNVSLDAVKRTIFGEAELNKVEIIVTESDNEIVIETKQPITDAMVFVEMDIKVPNNTFVEFARTTNGRLQITGIKGDTEASSTNGEIIIKNVDGYVEASTTNGRIDIQETTGISNIETTNGRIDAQIFDYKEDIDISCTNGEITVFINPSLNADIEARTSNGRISLNDLALNTTTVEETHLVGTLGTGGNKISITTVNGDVNINKLVI